MKKREKGVKTLGRCPKAIKEKPWGAAPNPGRDSSLHPVRFRVAKSLGEVEGCVTKGKFIAGKRLV